MAKEFFYSDIETPEVTSISKLLELNSLLLQPVILGAYELHLALMFEFTVACLLVTWLRILFMNEASFLPVGNDLIDLNVVFIKPVFVLLRWHFWLLTRWCFRYMTIQFGGMEFSCRRMVDSYTVWIVESQSFERLFFLLDGSWLMESSVSFGWQGCGTWLSEGGLSTVISTQARLPDTADSF